MDSAYNFGITQTEKRLANLTLNLYLMIQSMLYGVLRKTQVVSYLFIYLFYCLKLSIFNKQCYFIDDTDFSWASGSSLVPENIIYKIRFEYVFDQWFTSGLALDFISVSASNECKSR